MNTRSIKTELNSHAGSHGVQAVHKLPPDALFWVCVCMSCTIFESFLRVEKKYPLAQNTQSLPNIAAWSKKAGETVATTIAAVELIKTPQPQHPNENINNVCSGTGFIYRMVRAVQHTHNRTHCTQAHMSHARVQNRRLRMRVS